MSEDKSGFVKIMPLEEWRALQAELAQLRALKSVIDRLRAMPNTFIVQPRGDESVHERTFIAIHDFDYIDVPIVNVYGDTLINAFEKALAEYERLSKLDEPK